MRTACGDSKEVNVGPVIGQGTAGAGLISALNLDMGLNHLFKGSNDLYKYGNIEKLSLAYQNDVGSITRSQA